MPSITDVAARIQADNLPVLFADTCVLLDVIRATYRCLTGCVEQAVELLSLAAAAPPRCLIVLSSLVPIEWNTNAPVVTDEVKRHLAKIQEQSAHFHDASDALGLVRGFGRAPYSAPGLPDRLQDLSQKLLHASISLDADNDSRVRAVGRIVSNIPPARKGAEVKDCTILEEYLEVSRQARAASFTRKLVFCTSNTNDYCLPSGFPHPNLVSDYSSVNLVFTASLPHAVHQIKTL